jgi:UDP-N-acetylglucosamine 4-epimerase
VIPKWTAAMILNEDVKVNGDGETSRDFCFVDNAVQANLLAALAPDEARDQVYNVAFGGRTTLNQLYDFLAQTLGQQGVQYDKKPVYADFRPGDVRHSQANIGKAEKLLGYSPAYDILRGLEVAMPWYVKFLR